MKNAFLVLFLALLMLPGLNVQSQNPERFPKLRERITLAKLREIRLSLNLDQATFERFRPIYLEYDREITGIDFRKMARLMKVNADSLSSEEADLMIVNQMKTARSLIDIREKYYPEFRKVISPQQIIKLYQTEAEIRKKVMQELKKRMMSR